MRTFIGSVVVTIALGVFGASLGVARLEGHMADAQQRLATLAVRRRRRTASTRRRELPTTRAGCRGSAATTVRRSAPATRRSSTGRGTTTSWCRPRPSRCRRRRRQRGAAARRRQRGVSEGAGPLEGQGRDDEGARRSRHRLPDGAQEQHLAYREPRTTTSTSSAARRAGQRQAAAAAAEGSAEESDNGESGAPSPATSSKGFQIYIPLEQGEKNPSAARPARPRRRNARAKGRKTG